VERGDVGERVAAHGDEVGVETCDDLAGEVVEVECPSGADGGGVEHFVGG
jgi:hypothetical protein